MGLSTPVGLILLVILVISVMGVFLNSVNTVIRLNDPVRIGLISRHVKENLWGYKNSTSLEIVVQNEWGEDTFITAIILIYDANASPYKEVRLKYFIRVPFLSTISFDNGTINEYAGYEAIKPEEWLLVFNSSHPSYLHVILVTSYGNPFIIRRLA